MLALGAGGASELGSGVGLGGVGALRRGELEEEGPDAEATGGFFFNFLWFSMIFSVSWGSSDSFSMLLAFITTDCMKPNRRDLIIA